MYDPDLVSFVPVNDEDADQTARHRAKKLGPGKNIVTVIIDTGLRYLKGDLFGEGFGVEVGGIDPFCI
jgi:hypothetical protein